jgi:hypothetical protein
VVDAITKFKDANTDGKHHWIVADDVNVELTAAAAGKLMECDASSSKLARAMEPEFRSEAKCTT